jgi:hypothetical protein
VVDHIDIEFVAVKYWQPFVEKPFRRAKQLRRQPIYFTIECAFQVSVASAKIDVLEPVHSESVRPSEEEVEDHDPYLGREIQ